jgi:hypothetical protein
VGKVGAFPHPYFPEFVFLPSPELNIANCSSGPQHKHERLERGKTDGKERGGVEGNERETGGHLFSSIMIIKVIACYARSFILNTLVCYLLG